MAGTSPAMTRKGRLGLCCISLALLLAACAAPPSRVPPFAAKPYVPFVRAFLSAHNDFHHSFPSNNWAETTPAYDLGSRQHRRLLIGDQP